MSSAAVGSNETGWGEEIMSGVYIMKRGRARQVPANVVNGEQANFEKVYEDLAAATQLIQQLQTSNAYMIEFLAEQRLARDADPAGWRRRRPRSSSSSGAGGGEPRVATHNPPPGDANGSGSDADDTGLGEPEDDKDIIDAVVENEALLREKEREVEALRGLIEQHSCGKELVELLQGGVAKSTAPGGAAAGADSADVSVGARDGVSAMLDDGAAMSMAALTSTQAYL